MAKIKTAQEWLEIFEKDNFIDTKNYRETIPALTIIGGLQFGTTEEAKQKIKKWIGLKETGHKVKYFEKCWNNLVENGVFKNGTVVANLDGKYAHIEFALLISVAQGYVRRVEQAE